MSMKYEPYVVDEFNPFKYRQTNLRFSFVGTLKGIDYDVRNIAVIL
jgi:hypothetical protein